MDGPIQHPYTLKMVKPFSDIEYFYRRRTEVLRAVMEREGDGVQGEEQVTVGVISELEGGGLQDAGQENDATLCEFEGDGLQSEQQKNDGLSSESEGDGVQRAARERAGIPEEEALHSTIPEILTPKEQELEDDKELEELTGVRPPS